MSGFVTGVPFILTRSAGARPLRVRRSLRARAEFVVVVVPCAALALLATCSSPQPTTTPEPAAAHAQSPRDLSAVAFSVAIDARDELGIPRLIRAVAPRPAPA